MSDSSSDEDPYNFVKVYEKKVKENKINPRTLQKKEIKDLPNGNDTFDLTSSNTITESEVESTVDLTSITINNLVDHCLPSSSQTTEASTGTVPVGTNVRTSRTRRCKKAPNPPITGPIICLGDFDDGYNIPPPIVKHDIKDGNTLLAEQKMESKKEEDEKYLILELNREVTVKVQWLESSIHKFTLRRFQSIESIFEHFAKSENIAKDQVLLKLDNKRLSTLDTPQSINYRCTDFIDGSIEFYRSIQEHSFSREDEDPVDEAKFKIKQQNVRNPLFISMKKTDQMAVLYIKLSEKLGLDINSFRLEFDGDKIDKSATMESLDLDGDECLELFEKNK